MRTHSLLEMFYNVGGCVDVPEEHIAEGRTFATFQQGETPLLRILSSKDRPDNDFVSVNMREYWY